MTNIAKIVSLISLAATIVPSCLYFTGAIDHQAVKWTAIAGTVAWFIATPLWMGRETKVDSNEVEI